MSFAKTMTDDVSLDVAQPQFGKGYHDSLQYHFFCGDAFFSMRVFETRHFTHHSAWAFTGRSEELLNSSEPLERIGQQRLNLKGSRLQWRAGDHDGEVRILGAGGKQLLDVSFTRANTFVWSCLAAPAIHQTHLRGEITYGGRTYAGTGYCKRYWWDDNIEYWGYRFVQSLSAGGDMIWTADATFASTKYAYFKVAKPDGMLAVAAEKDSAHRNDAAYGVVNGAAYEIRLSELGLWETALRSDRMDSKMRQRFCKMTIARDGRQETGYALNETCFGTIR